MINITMLDDVEDDLEKYSSDLDQFDEITVTPLLYAGREDLLKQVVESQPKLVLVDYQLLTAQGGALPKHGTSVAAELREHLSSIPIVLMTRGNIVHDDPGPRLDLENVIDGTILKSELTANPIAVRDRLLGLEDIFSGIRGLEARTVNSVAGVMGFTTDDLPTLIACMPPGTNGVDGWRVQATVRWIVEVLLKYPGLLYDSLHASVLLGIDHADFLSEPIQRYFEHAKYRGPMGIVLERWHSDRLHALAYGVLKEANIQAQPTHHFVTAWNKLQEHQVKQSVCCVSEKTPASSVCFVLNKPVLRMYSLPYHPDNRPNALDEARVSFTAVRESNDFDEVLVSPDSIDLVEGIQREAE